jgi:hypothetical protein
MTKRTAALSASSAFAFVLAMGVLPEGRRNLAFGLFYAGYGVGWLVGSVTAGLLYGHSILAVIVFSVTVQLASLPIFVAARRMDTRRSA